jgi:hypothetical protein
MNSGLTWLGESPSGLTIPTSLGGRQLNPAAFVAPATAVQGDLGRNALRGFNLAPTDLSARGSFRITETVSLIFRADMFNALNHPNFGNPVASIGGGYSVYPQGR